MRSQTMLNTLSVFTGLALLMLIAGSNYSIMSAPPKFGDIGKAARDVLNDDYRKWMTSYCAPF